VYFLLFKKIEVKIVNKNEEIFKSSLAFPFPKYQSPDICYSTQSYMPLFNIFQLLSSKAKYHPPYAYAWLYYAMHIQHKTKILKNKLAQDNWNLEAEHI